MNLSNVSNPTIFEINENHEHVIIGLIDSIVSFLAFPVCIPLIYTLHVRKELNENISYKLINVLSICDFLQSVIHFLTGIFIIFPIFTERINPIVRILGWTLNTLWLASFVVIAVLALIRLGVTFFRTKSNKWALWMKVILFLGSLYIFVIWVIGCTTLNFQLVGISWSYDMTVVYADILSSLELYFCSSSLVLSFTSYIIILGSIYKKKRKSFTQKSFSLRTEIGILTQATVITTYMAATLVLWHNAEHWFKMTDITSAVLNGLWILVTHVNAFLLIATNRTVRNQFLSMVGRKSKISNIGRSQTGNTVLVNRKMSTVVS